MFLRILLLSLLMAGSSLCWAESHKIIWLTSGPRALSTAFLRMMESRGDFAIFHEPTIPLYCIEHCNELTAGWFRDNAHTTFDEVKENLFAAQKESHVFVKEMSFAFYESALNDQELLANPSVYFVFLVRNPHHSSISYYRKLGGIVPGMCEWLGLKQLYEEYEAVREKSPNGALILFSEEFYGDTRSAMLAFCNQVGIPFSERAFVWKQHNANFDGSEWNEQKIGDQFHHWHGRAIQSRQMEQPTAYEVDEMGNPTFSEIANQSDREELVRVYRENLTYYKKFQEAIEDHLLPR